MALDTSSKRRSSVSVCQAWQPTPPSPTDSPGTIDRADREHSAFAYSGIAADAPASAVDLRRFLEHYTRMRRGR